MASHFPQSVQHHVGLGGECMHIKVFGGFDF